MATFSKPTPEPDEDSNRQPRPHVVHDMDWGEDEQTMVFDSRGHSGGDASNPLITPPRPIHWLCWLLIVVVAAGLRFADLSNAPPGLFRDEAEKGFSAWTLAHTLQVVQTDVAPAGAMVVTPRTLPWMMRVMGNRTSAIYQYADALFMIGSDKPTVARTRAASAAIGTLAVAITGALLLCLWGPRAGLSAAIWLALCPWHLVFSRWALEGIFVPLFIACALAGIAASERARRWGWPLAAAALGLLFYCYTGAQPFALAWGALMALIYWRQLRDFACEPGPAKWIALGLLLFFVVPTLVLTIATGGSQRLSRVALWSDPALGGTQLIAHFLSNYAAHFNPRFLFISGDAQPRHAVPGMGQLVPLDLILLPLGLWGMWRRRAPLRVPLLLALLLGPLPAALTREGIPHGLRAIAMVLPAAAISGYGLAFAYELLVSRHSLKIARIAFAAALLIAFSCDVRYWSAAHSSPLEQVAFQSSARSWWETLSHTASADSRIYVDARLIYAPYFQWFYFPQTPAELADKPDSRFIYFDAARQPVEKLRAGLRAHDWLLTLAPPNLVLTAAGTPLVTDAEARAIGEWQTVAYQGLGVAR